MLSATGKENKMNNYNGEKKGKGQYPGYAERGGYSRDYDGNESWELEEHGYIIGREYHNQDGEWSWELNG